jgi:RNase P/RNase MRP subunit POP5
LRIDADESPEAKELINTIWEAVTKLYGEHGASLTSMALITYNADAKTAVIRASLETLNQLRAAIATITAIRNKEAAVHVDAVSGTIKALAQKLQTQNVTQHKA